MNETPRLLTAAEVAKVLRTARVTSVREMLARGEIEGAFRLFGRFWRVPVAGLEKYLTAQGEKRQ